MSVGTVLTEAWKSVLRSILWVFIFNCTSIHLYSDFKKGKKCTLVCNVSNDLEFCLPFSVDINTSKAFNFCTVLQFKHFYKKLLCVLCLRNYKIDNK
jgi:hypothetical protein